MDQEDGCKEAKRLLAEIFGSTYKVTNAWISKISNGPFIKANDREALLGLADGLLNCELTLRATGRLNQVNRAVAIIMIIK